MDHRCASLLAPAQRRLNSRSANLRSAAQSLNGLNSLSNVADEVDALATRIEEIDELGCGRGRTHGNDQFSALSNSSSKRRRRGRARAPRAPSITTTAPCRRTTWFGGAAAAHCALRRRGRARAFARGDATGRRGLQRADARAVRREHNALDPRVRARAPRFSVPAVRGWRRWQMRETATYGHGAPSVRVGRRCGGAGHGPGAPAVHDAPRECNGAQ